MNVLTIVGNLGQDPELRTSQEGSSVCTFSVATRRAGGGEDGADWHRVVAFGKTADLCAAYLKKGRQVGVTGRVTYRSYEKDGVTKYITEVIAGNVEFLGGGYNNAGE